MMQFYNILMSTQFTESSQFSNESLLGVLIVLGDYFDCDLPSVFQVCSQLDRAEKKKKIISETRVNSVLISEETRIQDLVSTGERET
jgi:hypothetical protein